MESDDETTDNVIPFMSEGDMQQISTHAAIGRGVLEGAVRIAQERAKEQGTISCDLTDEDVMEIGLIVLNYIHASCDIMQQQNEETTNE